MFTNILTDVRIYANNITDYFGAAFSRTNFLELYNNLDFLASSDKPTLFYLDGTEYFIHEEVNVSCNTTVRPFEPKDDIDNLMQEFMVIVDCELEPKFLFNGTSKTAIALFDLGHSTCIVQMSVDKNKPTIIDIGSKEGEHIAYTTFLNTTSPNLKNQIENLIDAALQTYPE